MSEKSTPPGRHRSHKGRWILGGILFVLAAVGIASLILARPVTVPDVRKMAATDANIVIKRAGLVVGSVGEIATTTVGEDLIAWQSPAGGEKKSRGDAVDYRIAKEPTPEPVPNVVGLGDDMATQKLTDTLYLPEEVSVYDSHVKRGIVVAQTPPYGYEWTTGQPVAIAVSLGTANGAAVAVPACRGMTLEQAQQALAKVGLKGQVVIANPTATYSGTVFSQIPNPEVLVPKGETVLLVFDRL